MADKTNITITTKITLTSLEDAVNLSKYFKEMVKRIIKEATVTVSIRQTSKTNSTTGGG